MNSAQTAPAPTMSTMHRVGTFLSMLAKSPALGTHNIRRQHAALGVQPTPARVVHTERTFELLHFPAKGDAASGPPILLVPSLINRWYVLDLLPGHSLVEALVARGHSVYVLAWQPAHDGHGTMGLDRYVDSFLDRAVRRCLRHSGAQGVTLLGQCLGGTLALAYAALRPERVARLVTLTTPVDYTDAGLLTTWTDRDINHVAQSAATYPGVVPDSVVYGAFPLLNARALVTRHRLLFQMLHVPEFARIYQAIDLWTNDHLAMSSRTLRDLVEKLYQDNALWKGEWVVAGQAIRLEDVRCPFLNVASKNDEIVPLSTTRPLLERVGSEQKSDYISPMGHITLILGSPLRFETYKAISEFCC